MESNRSKDIVAQSPAVEFVHTTEALEILRSIGASLFVTTYQAQRLFTFAVGTDRLSMFMRIFERPTGLALSGNRLALVARNQIWLFESTTDVRDESGERLPYDRTFVPRMSYVTGDVLGHEVAIVGNDVLFVNTRFSCIAKASSRWSFEPLWMPKFVSKLAPEDRCHLSGFALDNNSVRFVTALAPTDTPRGWSERKRDGGVIIDVGSREIVASGFAMPHSPRIYAGRLWVLESGMGELQTVDPKSGVRETVCRLPGYLRGLAFFEQYAFVGMCKIREQHLFGGLPIQQLYSELHCGVAVIDIRSGAVVATMNFTRGIEELFDIQVAPNLLRPHIVGFEEETVDGLYVLPPGSF